MRSSTRFPLELLLASLAIAAPVAHAQAPRPEFGQETRPLPGFESKSEVLPATGDASGANREVSQTSRKERDGEFVYYLYKGVQLPLKKYIEYEGSQPFLEIVDGEDVLWVAKRADLYRVLDKILYNELDTLTGAGDELFARHRFPAAYQAYEDVYRILTDPKSELDSPNLRHYPAVRSYLQLRMGQSLAWQSKHKWFDSERFLTLAWELRDESKRLKDDPSTGDMWKVPLNRAGELEAEAAAAAEEALALAERSGKLLEAAAAQNDRLWQAQNELGILAVERAVRAGMDGRSADAKREYEAARDHFRKARVGDAKEMIDSNLVAVYSGLADIAHAEGRWGEALEHLRSAMELADFEQGARAEERGGDNGTTAFAVTFEGFHPSRGERIVVTAELAAALTRKYLEVERDRKRSAARPATGEPEVAILQRWKRQGDKLLADEHWKAGIAFFTGLHDHYAGAAAREPAPAEFKTWIQTGIERSFAERAAFLDKAGRDDDAIALLGFGEDYLPNSRLLANAQILSRFRKADSALARGQWQEAEGHLLTVYKEIWKEEDDDPEKLETQADLAVRLGAAYVGLTRQELARGNLEQAGKYADKARRLKPARPEWQENHARVLIASAEAAERAGDKDTALRLYDQARAEGAGASRIRAAFARDKVRLQLAIPKARRVVVAATRQYGVLVVFACIGLVAGVPVTRNFLSSSARKRRAKALRNQAVRAYDAKSWNEAIDLFNDFLVQNPGAADGEAFELLARSYRMIGDYENALRYFDRAANRLPGRRYNLERAEIYLMRRNLPLALRQLRTSASLQADAEKLAHLIDVLRSRDGEGPFHVEALAAIRLTAGDFDGARRLYNRLLELDPRSTKTLRALAELSRRAGREKDRRLYLEKLIQIEPDDGAALREVGNLYAAAGELQQAIVHFRRAFDLSPAEGLAARIAELEAELLVREAEAEIARLLAEPPQPVRRFRIGELHWRLGRPREAKKFFEECATIKDLQGRALRYLGLIALAQGDANDAVSLLRGYLAKRTNLAPDAPEKEARYALGEAYEQLDDADSAMQQFEAIFEADPGYKDVAKRVKARLARTGVAPRAAPAVPGAMIDCPFCKRRIPAESELCPNCRFQIAKPAGGQKPGGPLALPGKMPGDDDPTSSGS